MKKILLSELKHMQDTLDGNIKSIKSLLATSDSVKELIDELQKNENKDENTLKRLQSTRESINRSIEDFLHNTQDLFKIYTKIVDAL